MTNIQTQNIEKKTYTSANSAYTSCQHSTHHWWRHTCLHVFVSSLQFYTSKLGIRQNIQFNNIQRLFFLSTVTGDIYNNFALVWPTVISKLWWHQSSNRLCTSIKQSNKYW